MHNYDEPVIPAGSLTTDAITLLQPLVARLLRRGFTVHALNDLVKWVFVHTANEEFALNGRHGAITRIASTTGLTRKEVARLIELSEVRLEQNENWDNRALRVVTGWKEDPYFSPRHRTVSLKYNGKGPTFAELVRRYSGDMTPKAILEQLVNLGLVKTLKNGRIKLLN